MTSEARKWISVGFVRQEPKMHLKDTGEYVNMKGVRQEGQLLSGSKPALHCSLLLP